MERDWQDWTEQNEIIRNYKKKFKNKLYFKKECCVFTSDSVSDPSTDRFCLINVYFDQNFENVLALNDFMFT